MLQSIHEHIKGWFAFLIFGLITISFLICVIMYYVTSMKRGSSTIAKINGTKISMNQFNQAYQRAQKNIVKRRGNILSAVQQKQLKQAVLNQLITKTVLTTQAKKLGFYVSFAEVNAFITQMPVFQANGNFSPERFQQILYANSSSPEEFMKSLGHDLLTNQVKLGFVQSNFSLPNELSSTYALLNQKRDFGYFIISPKHFRSNVSTAKSVIKAFYQKNKQTFQVPQKASFNYVLLSQKSLAKRVSISEAEIQQYYQDNKQNYRTSIKWKIQALTIRAPQGSTSQQKAKAEKITRGIIAQLQRGVSFNHIVKAYDGKTMWVEQGQISDMFATILSQMKPNQISKPFQTRAGLMMVKLLAIKPGKLKSFASVRKEIRSSLKDQKVQNLLSEKSENLSNLAYTNPDSLKPVADSLGLQIQTTPMTTRGGLKSGILTNQDVLTAAFTPSVLTEGTNSNPIALKTGDLVVLRVNKYVPAHVPALDKIYSKVKNQYINQMASAKAKAQAILLRKDLLQGKDPQTLAKRYRLLWNYRTGIKSDAKDIPSKVLNFAFHLPPAVGKQIWAVAAITLNNGDFAVIGLKKVQLARKVSLTQKEKVILQRKLANYYGSLDYGLYARDAMNKAAIKKNPLPSEQTQ